MEHSHYIGNPTFRKFVDEKSTYYVPVDSFLNAADNILVDTRNPHSAGFGGSIFDIETTDGTDTVKGPWHGTVPYDVCDVTELHFTKVTILANAKNIQYKGWPLIEDRDSIEFRLRVTGDVLYDEKEMVLGTFYRGDRIAQQLADLRQEDIYVHVKTAGGSRSKTCKPGGNLHPLAHRSGRNLSSDISAEQGGIVYG